MAHGVPFTMIEGLPGPAQWQIRRNFEEAVRALDAGTVPNIPFKLIADLPPKAQWQIRRNFEALECNCAGASDPSAAILADSPIGYWKLQDALGSSTFASLGSVSPGAMTIGGSPTLQETVNGVVSTRFNPGNGDSGSISSSVSWSPHQGASGAMSVEAWVYPRAFSASEMIFAKGSNTQWEHELSLDATGLLTAGVLDKPTGASVMTVTAAAAIPLNTWTHVAYTYNRATPAMILYIDGVVSASSAAAAGASANGTASTTIGQRAGLAGSTRFSGNLAYIALFSTELSAARIAAHAAFTP